MAIFLSSNKSNSPPIRQIPSFSIFGHLTCHVIMSRWGTRKPQDMLLGKKSFSYRSPSDRYCQSFLSTEHIFDLGLKTLELPNMNFYLKETFRNGSLISRTLIQKWTECKFESKTALSEAGRYFLKWVRPFLDGYIIRTAGTTSRGLFPSSLKKVVWWQILGWH